jgi:GNAT superfamily N-acetyltransferase
VRLWQESGLPYRPDGRDRRERIARELAGPCSTFLAAEEDSRLVGAVLGTQDGRKGWINRLVMAPSRRREGVGEALVGIPGTSLKARRESSGDSQIASLISVL